MAVALEHLTPVRRSAASGCHLVSTQWPLMAACIITAHSLLVWALVAVGSLALRLVLSVDWAWAASVLAQVVSALDSASWPGKQVSIAFTTALSPELTCALRRCLADGLRDHGRAAERDRPNDR